LYLIYYSNHCEIKTLISNSTSKGAASKSCDTKSGGDKNEAAINITNIKYLRYFLKIEAVIKLNFVSKAIRIGNSKTIPKDNRIELIKPV
jgi:hypothetical protein